MSVEVVLNEQTTGDTDVGTKANLADIQAKVVSYMISKRFKQFNADILVKADECRDDEILLLVDDEPLPMPIDNQATGLGKLSREMTITIYLL